MSKKKGYTYVSPHPYYQPIILGLEHGITFKEYCDVNWWIQQEITTADCKDYLNAKTAWDIKNSKLYKVMK